MTTTPASTTPRVSSTIGVRIRSLAGWADQIDTAQLLHVTAVTVAAAVAVLAMLDVHACWGVCLCGERPRRLLHFYRIHVLSFCVAPYAINEYE